MPKPYPSEQARQEARDRLARQGITAKEWAIQHELTPSTVYAVLNGQKKCLRGESHRAAVLLGIKESSPTT
ncbi:DNA-binding protein [Pseudomonas sp. BIGb0427]|uniref:DNA-binding protein n=1 Tax=Pseudomonas sp. BIGb0427 TaxID=2724470 RepID=UPI0016903F77|nr:DNA-binding protein [Pseudomonas sp. BIGb0427]NLU60048.1 DNA-binding protein [Pseudomonas sp. BIGb0427]QPG61225.1 DNA-binding protein [Pseudomonas sp. BIGb0427]